MRNVESVGHMRWNCNLDSTWRSFLGTKLFAADLPRQLESMGDENSRKMGQPLSADRSSYKYDRL